MKTKDLLTIATAALGTATLTVAAFWAGPIDAGNDADAPPAKLAKAKLVSHGVELTLAPTGGRTFQAGDQPEFELTALNTAGQVANLAICVTMNSTTVASAFARTPLLPKALWQQVQQLTLKPNETKVLTLCANTKLPVKSLISVSLREEGPKAGPSAPGIVALSFSTAAPAAQPVVALAR